MEISPMARHLFSSAYGSHAIVTYLSADNFREIYSDYCKIALSQGEMVVLILHYDSLETARAILKAHQVDVKGFEKTGQLLLQESQDAYFTVPDGTFKLARTLVQRARKEGKRGVSILADMGVFFGNDKLEQMIKYESSLPVSYEGNLRGYCFYLLSDYSMLSDEQKRLLIGYHNESTKA